MKKRIKRYISVFSVAVVILLQIGCAQETVTGQKATIEQESEKQQEKPVKKKKCL